MTIGPELAVHKIYVNFSVTAPGLSNTPKGCQPLEAEGAAQTLRLRFLLEDPIDDPGQCCTDDGRDPEQPQLRECLAFPGQC